MFPFKRKKDDRWSFGGESAPVAASQKSLKQN